MEIKIEGNLLSKLKLDEDRKINIPNSYYNLFVRCINSLNELNLEQIKSNYNDLLNESKFENDVLKGFNREISCLQMMLRVLKMNHQIELVKDLHDLNFQRIKVSLDCRKIDIDLQKICNSNNSKVINKSYNILKKNTFYKIEIEEIKEKIKNKIAEREEYKNWCILRKDIQSKLKAELKENNNNG